MKLKFSVFLTFLITILLVGCNSTPTKSNLEYLTEGKDLAIQAQMTLGGSLKKALDSGTLYALNFCNANAETLTSNASKDQGVVLRRVSDNPRNVKNSANLDELNSINSFKKLLVEGKSPKGKFYNDEDMKFAHYPIITNGLCMQCHGKNIDSLTLETLKDLYPDDKATGYNVGEIRGIWVVEFPE